MMLTKRLLKWVVFGSFSKSSTAIITAPAKFLSHVNQNRPSIVTCRIIILSMFFECVTMNFCFDWQAWYIYHIHLIRFVYRSINVVVSRQYEIWLLVLYSHSEWSIWHWQNGCVFGKLELFAVIQIFSPWYEKVHFTPEIQWIFALIGYCLY